MIKGIIFDVDGTLLDSLDMWVQIDNLYIESKGFKATEDISRQLFTYSLEDGAAYIKEYFKLQDSVTQIIEELTAIANDYYIQHVKIKKGVIQTLEYFKNRQIPMTIATSNNKTVVQQVLENNQLSSYFLEILTSDEIGSNKDQPDIYLKCCEYMNSKPENTLVFEDALHAINTAKNADFKVVGCFDQYSIDYQDEIKSLVDYYVIELDEIIKLL